MDRDVIENIKALAEEQDRSVSQYINLVLKGHLKRLAEKGAKKWKKRGAIRAPVSFNKHHALKAKFDFLGMYVA